MRPTGGRRQPPYKLLSLLLQYPDEEICGARAELAQAIRELPRGPEQKALERFFAHFSVTPVDELRQQYVATFDLQKRSSLYLTFYTEGDTRKRGMALLRLKRLYAAAGFRLGGRELPDYLPVMLEFAELAPAGHGAQILAEHRTGLELLRIHLRESESPYVHLIEGVCAGLPGLALPELESVRRLLQEGPPNEEVGLQPFAPPEVMPSMGARR
ncbi:nitrate reductase molybdenum cofactor assembly chaperone [bacterium]|nr:MAG: nitrate reductase molybdenum cofactor assembly chaperone [bacterium]